MQAVETEAIKIAFDLAPWTTNYWCYTKISFTPILDQLKNLGKSFVNSNQEDPLIKPLIKQTKPSQIGKHSPLYKILMW